jgi:Helix-turn-helix domain
MSDHQTQRDRILRLLEIQPSGNWVPLPAILSLGIASHTRRIHELRKVGHEIEMQSWYSGPNNRHTAYRLVKRASAEGTAA